LQQAASSIVFAGFAPEMEDSWGIYINNCFPTPPLEIASDEQARIKFWRITFEILVEKLQGVDEESKHKIETEIGIKSG
jgi:hypothetical protein